MSSNATNPAHAAGAAGFAGRSSSFSGENPHHLTQAQSSPQTEIAPTTAPDLLDLLYLNVELALRLCAIKATQAAVDSEIGELDEIVVRNMTVASDCLKEAFAKFDRIKQAKEAHANTIVAESMR